MLKPLPPELDPIARFLLPLERLSPLAPPPVVYLLLGPSQMRGADPEKEAILYVGGSTNFTLRRRSHLIYKEFERIVVLPIGERDLHAAEAAVIRHYQPEQNRGMRHGMRPRPSELEVERVASYLGLVDDGSPPPSTAYGLPPFRPDLAAKLWHRLKERARNSLLFIAERGTYHDSATTRRRRNPEVLNYGSLRHVATLARTMFRSQPPFTSLGPYDRRTFSMERDVAKAIMRAAREQGI
jgi:hypothetical protein